MKTFKIEEDKKTGKLLFEFGIFFMILNLLCVTGIWQSVLCDWKVSGEAVGFAEAYIGNAGKYAISYLNQRSLYLSILSFVFSFLGNKEEVVLIVNMVLQLSGIVFLFIGMRKVAGVLFSLITVLISVVCSIFFFSVAIDSPMHLMWFLCALLFWGGMKTITEKEKLGKVSIVFYIILGILLGCLLYIDIVGLMLVIPFCVVIWQLKKGEKKEERICNILLACITGIFFILLFYLWNNYRMDIVGWKRWFTDRQNFMLQTNTQRQYVSMAVIYLISTVFCGIYISKNRKIDIEEEEEEETFRNMSLMEPMDNVKKSSNIKEEKNDVAEDILTISTEKKEVALAEKTEKSNEIENATSEVQEADKPKVKLLENPLPVPKKHVKKEMTYAFEPREDQMHYDLNNYSVDDDYDLKTGV